MSDTTKRLLKVTDEFQAFQEELRSANWDDPIIPGVPWLVQLNIDPKYAVLEVRLFNGSPVVFRRDYCLGVGSSEYGDLTLWASPQDLEEFGEVGHYEDPMARRRAKEVPLPFAKAFLSDVKTSQEGDGVLLRLIVEDATGASHERRPIQIHMGPDACVMAATDHSDTEHQ